jgi:chromosome partitioning protein
MFDGRTRLAPQVADEVRQHFPAELLDTVVPRSVRISEAPSHGLTVLQYDPSSPGSRAYLAAARELVRRWSAEPESPSSTTVPDAAAGGQ